MTNEVSLTSFECVIIGPDHYNTLNCVRALGNAQIPFLLILVSQGRKRTFVDKSKFCKNCVFLDQYKEIFPKLKYIAPLSNGIKPHLITTNDKSAVEVDKHYEFLKNYFIAPNVSSIEGGVIREMDKNRQMYIAKKVGFSVPRSKAMSLSSIPQSEIDSLTFPCIIKPQESFTSSKDFFRICRDKDEFLHYANELKTSLQNCLVQQFIENRCVKLIGGVRTTKGATILSGTIYKNKIGHKHNTLGLSAAGILTDDSKLFPKCIKYLEEIDYKGPFSFEFVNDNLSVENKDYFIEFNLRTDGLFYFYTAAGINLPKLWVDESSFSDDTLSVKRPIRGMNEFLYMREYFNLKNLFQTIRDFIQTNVFCIYSLTDIKPFIYKLKS